MEELGDAALMRTCWITGRAGTHNTVEGNAVGIIFSVFIK